MTPPTPEALALASRNWFTTSSAVPLPCEHQYQWQLSSGELWGKPENIDGYDTKLISGVCVKCGAVHKPSAETCH